MLSRKRRHVGGGRSTRVRAAGVQERRVEDPDIFVRLGMIPNAVQPRALARCPARERELYCVPRVPMRVPMHPSCAGALWSEKTGDCHEKASQGLHQRAKKGSSPSLHAQTLGGYGSRQHCA
jgi:hypothetical protein